MTQEEYDIIAAEGRKWLAAWAEDSRKYQEEYKAPEPSPSMAPKTCVCFSGCRRCLKD